MKLMVGHSTRWSEAYGVIEDVQDYDLDKPVAAASLLDDVAELITVAKQRGGPARMILVLEPEQGSTVIGRIEEIEQYDLDRAASRASLLTDIKLLIKKGKKVVSVLLK